MEENYQSCTVKFKVNCKTNYGESICLIGNLEVLHSWDISNPIELTSFNYSERTPAWETEDLTLPGNSIMEYKFYIKTLNGKTKWEWTSKRDNRKLKLEPGKHLIIYVTFGILQTEIFVKENGNEVRKDNIFNPGLKIVLKLWYM